MPDAIAAEAVEPTPPTGLRNRFRTHLVGSGERLTGIGALLFKATLSTIVAFVLYEAIISFFVWSTFGSPAAYEQLIVDTNQKLKAGGIHAEICLEAPRGSKADCGEKLKDSDPSVYEPWLSFGVTDNGGRTERVEFAVSHRFLVRNPKILNSSHSLTRVVERAHQATYQGDVPKDATSGLKLCAGTRKVLDDGICTKVSIALKSLGQTLTAKLDWVRIVALFFGIIQFAVFAVFWYIAIECWWTWRQLISTPTVFFKSAPAGTIELVDDLGAALEKYNATETRSPGDRLMARLIQASTRAPNATPSLSSSVLEDYREFQVSETEGALGSLDIANEAMLKLSFVGTIWGIGSALFLIRELDSVDPIQRIVTKSDMFAGIGTGFGTTLVGVLLSIVASFQIQGVARKWEDYVNGYYRTILNDSRNIISSYFDNLPSGPQPYIRHRPVKEPEPPSFFATFGLLAVLLIVLAVFYLQWELLSSTVAQFWSQVAGG